VGDHANIQQTRTKRQQPLNAGRTNGRKLQLEIEGYPTVPRTACNLVNYTLFVRAHALTIITFRKLHPFYPFTLVGL
jgi:hypothetical protein